MTKINQTDIQNSIKSGRVVLAFVDESTILSNSTLRILKEINVVNTKIFYVNVEENKECFSKFSLRIIPTIHVYESGELTAKLNLPFTKQDLECLIN